MDETLQTELIPIGKQTQTPHNADTSKHCQYHRNYGHTTESCQALKDKIKELIQADHLVSSLRIPSLLLDRHNEILINLPKTVNASDEGILKAETFIDIRHDKNETRAQLEELDQGVKASRGIIVPGAEYEKSSTL